MDFIALLTNFESVLWYFAIVLVSFGALFAIMSIFFNIGHLTGELGDHDIGDHDIGDQDALDSTIDEQHGIEGIKHIDDGFTKDITKSKAPLFLRLSSFTLTFGVLGLTTLRYANDNFAWRISRIFLIILFPILITYIVSKIWEKISATTSEPVPKGKDLIGMIGTVIIPVDHKGGTIEVYLGKNIGYSKMYAKSFSYHDRFEKGQQVRIVGIKQGYYLVDNP